jgi:sRNA-binding protein
MASAHVTNMLIALRVILGRPADLPVVFWAPHPRVLMLGAYEAMIARYPSADQAALTVWFSLWCSHPEYKARLRTGTHRHDLDGNNAGLIANDKAVRAAAAAAVAVAPAWLTLDAVVARSGKSRLSIQAAARRGELAAEIADGKLRFPAAAVEAWAAHAVAIGRAKVKEMGRTRSAVKIFHAA